MYHIDRVQMLPVYAQDGTSALVSTARKNTLDSRTRRRFFNGLQETDFAPFVLNCVKHARWALRDVEAAIITKLEWVLGIGMKRSAVVVQYSSIEPTYEDAMYEICCGRELFLPLYFEMIKFPRSCPPQ